MNHLNDAQLADLLKADNIKAFDLLYRRYAGAIYANSLKLNRDAADAKDIVQEVFLALWDKRKTIDTQKSVAGWLFTCSYNKSVNQLKKQISAAKMIPIHPDREMTVRQEEIEANHSEIQARLLREAIGYLSPQKRKVFELCKIQGKSYEQAAIELSLSKHTVKEYLAGAIAIIKNYIRKHPGYFVNHLDTIIFILVLGQLGHCLF